MKFVYEIVGNWHRRSIVKDFVPFGHLELLLVDCLRILAVQFGRIELLLADCHRILVFSPMTMVVQFGHIELLLVDCLRILVCSSMAMLGTLRPRWRGGRAPLGEPLKGRG